MLFALIDLWAYRRRTGRYSHEALCRRGLALAVEKNFPNWREIPLGHSLFVSTTGSMLSWLIMYGTNGVLSHCAMLYGGGVVHDVTSKGVHRHLMSDYFDGASYLSILPPPPSADLEYARKFMDSILGAKYNYLGVLRLGLYIVFANSPSFSWRLAIDITLLAIAAATSFAWIAPALSKVVLLSLTFYLLVVLINRTLRWKTIISHFPH